jgi:AcrR family transcriptional regulator
VTNARSVPAAPVEQDAILLPGNATGTRRRLLEAAVVAFAERGYHGVSVRDLTSAVGIQGGSFYAHFPSKEELLYELMRLGHEGHQAAVREALLDAGADPTAQLRAATRANVSYQANWPLLVIVCNSELHGLAPEHRGRIIALRQMTGEPFITVIERGNASGAFRCEDPWLALSAIAAMGIRVGWWYRPPALRGDDSPLSDYPQWAASWLPQTDYDIDAIADAYAEFALRIVGATS